MSKTEACDISTGFEATASLTQTFSFNSRDSIKQQECQNMYFMTTQLCFLKLILSPLANIELLIYLRGSFY